MAPNIVVAAAGNLDHDRIVELVEAAVGDQRRARGPTALAAPTASTPALRFHQKETEQYHLCLGGPGLPRGDDRRFALRVLDTILGGSTSSRLFQEVREKRGLAYSVYSYVEPVRGLRPGGALRRHAAGQRRRGARRDRHASCARLARRTA